MSSLQTLDTLQGPSTDLAGLYGGVTILGQVFPGIGVVVEAISFLCNAGAQRAVGKEPIGEDEAGRVVGRWLASNGGAKAQKRGE